MSRKKILHNIEKYLSHDIILNLADDNNKVIISAHKIVLCSECIYFEKLFANFKEKTMSEISIKVPNASVCYDIIRSFYEEIININNLPDWSHLLESFKCRDFFGLKNDESLLLNINVPPEGFELLMDVIDLTSYDNKLIEVINRNLPKEYDLSKFPKKLIKKMIEKAMTYIIITGNDSGYIEIWNMTKCKLIDRLCGHSNEINCMCISPDGTKLVTGSSDWLVKLWDIPSKKLIYTLGDHCGYISNVYFTSDGNNVITKYFSDTIKIWDATTGCLIKTMTVNINTTRTSCFSFSPSYNIMGYGDTDGNILIIDVQTNVLINTLYAAHSHKIYKIYFSLDCKMVSTDNHTIKVWDININNSKIIELICIREIKLVGKLNVYYNYIFDLCVSPDGTKIITGGNDRSIKMWDIQTGNLLIYMANNLPVTNICFSFDSEKIFSVNTNQIKTWDVTTGHLTNRLLDDGMILCMEPIKKDNKLTRHLKKFI